MIFLLVLPAYEGPAFWVSQSGWKAMSIEREKEEQKSVLPTVKIPEIAPIAVISNCLFISK